MTEVKSDNISEKTMERFVLRIFSPLTATMYAKDDWGELEECSEEVFPAELCSYEMPESYCIAGNIIDREVQNGGNGLGCQPDISYTLTSADRHAVFSRQRSDEFLQNRVTATQSARQHKDATDLVCEPYQNTVGTIGYTDHKGINNQYVSEDKCIVENRRLIRRLTPLECERLQGFPDHWTDIPGASDSARYKALGNSVAIPCVDFVLRGIAYFLRKMKEEKEP